MKAGVAPRDDPRRARRRAAARRSRPRLQPRPAARARRERAGERAVDERGLDGRGERARLRELARHIRRLRERLGGRAPKSPTLPKNWPQYLNPIGEAEAANWNDTSGRPPNTRHDVGVALTVQKYRDNGFVILSDGPIAVRVPGFATPRIYDCLVVDPRQKVVIADEEKTTIYDVIFLNEDQVAKDVALMRFGGTADGLGVRVDRIGYSAHCFGCDLIDLRPLRLWDQLRDAGIDIWFDYLPDREDYH